MEVSTKSCTPSTTSTTRRQSATSPTSRPTLRELPLLVALLSHPVFVALVGLLIVALGISFWLVLVHPDGELLAQQPTSHEVVVNPMPNGNNEEGYQGHVAIAGAVQDPRGNDAAVVVVEDSEAALANGPHLTPRLPHFPIFVEIPNGDKLAQDTVQGRPTIAGIAHILNKFTQALHKPNLKLSSEQADLEAIIQSYFDWPKSM